MDDSENSAVYIGNLPPSFTFEQLFNLLSGQGRVQSARFRYEQIRAQNQQFQAATIVFHAHADAYKFLSQIQEQPDLNIQGRKLYACWSRPPVQETPGLETSRVLLIKGPGSIVNQQHLEAIWTQAIQGGFHRDKVITQAMACDQVWISYHFSSVREATDACTALIHAYPGKVKVEFTFDPCSRR